MRSFALGLTLSAALIAAGCAGKFDYTPPTDFGIAQNSKSVSKSKDQVWAELIPAISQKFFVINNLDKSSGLINISYAGDPITYVDCGHITSVVKNARGERTYSFPAARQRQQYEVMNDRVGLAFVDRKVNLEGRLNVIVSEERATKSTVTVNTRYVVNVEGQFSNPQGQSRRDGYTISFNTGATGYGQTISCRPTGNLEAELLALVRE